MNYKSLIENTKSVREFTTEPIEDTKISELKAFARASRRLVPDIEIEYRAFRNSSDEVSDKLKNIAGYNGNMISAPSYLIILSDPNEKYLENTGYIGENIALKATDLGISTCWVTFSDSEKVKDALNIDSSKEVSAIIALGYQVPSNKKKVVNQSKTGDNYSLSNMEIVENDTSSRISVQELVYLDEWGNNIDVDTLIQRGLLDIFSYTRMAPSTLNRQPWRFILAGGKVILTLKNDELTNTYESKVDAGIAMLFFELIASTTLVETHWNFDELDKDYKIPSDYKYIGYCNI
ncbi:MAG: nitroreductase family protein [Clostridioides sp.]|jgi:nitroreductase|nr:nitroreductase family protein [Clostridioides sp.]